MSAAPSNEPTFRQSVDLMFNRAAALMDLAPGLEADFTVLDLASTPAIAQRVAEAESLWEVLFPTIMMGDDRAIRSTWVAGRQAR